MAKRQRKQTIQIFLVIALVFLYLGQAGASQTLAAPAASTIRVAPNGSNDPGCGSEAAPCRTIQYAVNKANPGDTILVAAGTYTYEAADDTCTGPTGTTGVVCVRNTELTILGGYSTGNWTTPDPGANPTIIDGQVTYRGVWVVGTTTSLRMEGFTIQNGIARGIPIRTGGDAIFGYGGGMFVDLGTQPNPAYNITLRNLLFKNNIAIGENHDPYGGSGVGGGLALRGAANPTLEYLTFEGNEAWGGEGSQRGGYGIGGAMHTLYCSGVVLSHATVVNNTARGGWSPGSGSHNGETADAQGGGIANHHSDLELHYVDASGNWAIGGNATTTGGGTFGGALYVESGSLTVYDSSLHGNTALGGNGVNGGLAGSGGINAHNSDLLVQRTRIYSNVSRGGDSTGGGKSGSPQGGGVCVGCFVDGCSLEITNSVIADNALQFGEGDTSVGGGGGGIWLQGTYGATITHSTIARNRLEGSPLLGMAILLVNFATPKPSVVNLNYNIIASHLDYYDTNTQALFVFTGNTAILNRTLWAENDGNTNAGTGWNEGTIYDNNPIQADSPGFVSPGPPNHDYHILDTSAAREQATDSTIPDDIDGEARADGRVLDVGADEHLAPALTLASPQAGNGALHLNWEANLGVTANVHHYNLIVSCESGANPPGEGACDTPISAGLQTSFTLTGLTNGKTYTITVEARDASNTLLASDTKAGTPINFQYTVLVPIVSKNHH